MLNKLFKSLTKEITIKLMNWYFSKIDSKKNRENLVDKFLTTCPKKFSEQEYKNIRSKLLKLPLNKWGT